MQERSLETRGRIIDAALEQFAQSGYQATSVAQICHAAQVSKGAFYHHFPSKQALFLELLQGWLNVLDEQMRNARSISTSVPDTFMHMSGLMRRVFQAAGDNLPIFLEFLSQARHDQAVWEVIIAPYRRYQEFFAEMILEGVTEGSLKEIEEPGGEHAMLIAQVLVSLAVGILLQGLLDPQGADWQEVTQKGVQLILNNFLEVEE